MRTTTDALRSLKKYVYRALGDEWEVRLAWEEGAFKRPFARVGFAGPDLHGGSAMHDDITQAFNILCHPTEQADVTDTILEAQRVRELLSHAIRFGIAFTEQDAGGNDVLVSGYAMRIPLWDWDGVPAAETSVARAERGYYLRVNNLALDVIPDPADELRKAVSCDVRCTWRAPAPSVPEGGFKGTTVAIDAA